MQSGHHGRGGGGAHRRADLTEAAETTLDGVATLVFDITATEPEQIVLQSSLAGAVLGLGHARLGRAWIAESDRGLMMISWHAFADLEIGSTMTQLSDASWSPWCSWTASEFLSGGCSRAPVPAEQGAEAVMGMSNDEVIAFNKVVGSAGSEGELTEGHRATRHCW